MRKRMMWLLVGLALAGFFAVNAFEVLAKDETYQVVWPRGKAVVKIVPLAKRLNTLAGKTVCELWNGQFRGDETFPMIEQELTKRYPGVKFITWDKFGLMGGTEGAQEEKILAGLPDKLKKFGCDAVIGGNGC